MTVTLSLIEPPGPVQASVNTVLVVSAGVLSLPCACLVPVQPPEAVHEVALVDVQLSVEVPLTSTASGLALRSTVGAGIEVTVTWALREMLPPAPVHCSV